MSTHAKDYRLDQDKVSVFRKYSVQFMAHSEDEIPWEFQPETSQLLVNAGETALAFYKVYNKSELPVAGIAIYQIYPEECSLYFCKIQCFCFENQLLYPQEQVDLPVLFYLDPAINHDPTLKDCKEMMLTYHFFPSADQSIAYVLQEQIEKHQEEEKQLVKRRKDLEQMGVVLPEYQKGVVAPGFNPKDTAEMYVSKIIQNRRRMELTISKYEEELKRKQANPESMKAADAA